jgi:hypothetical protein
MGAYIGFWITKPDLDHEGHQNHDSHHAAQAHQSGHDSHMNCQHCRQHHSRQHEQSKLLFENNKAHSCWEGLIVDL